MLGTMVKNRTPRGVSKIIEPKITASERKFMCHVMTRIWKTRWTGDLPFLKEIKGNKQLNFAPKTPFLAKKLIKWVDSPRGKMTLNVFLLSIFELYSLIVKVLVRINLKRINGKIWIYELKK